MRPVWRFREARAQGWRLSPDSWIPTAPERATVVGVEDSSTNNFRMTQSSSSHVRHIIQSHEFLSQFSGPSFCARPSRVTSLNTKEHAYTRATWASNEQLTTLAFTLGNRENQLTWWRATSFRLCYGIRTAWMDMMAFIPENPTSYQKGCRFYIAELLRTQKGSRVKATRYQEHLP